MLDLARPSFYVTCRRSLLGITYPEQALSPRVVIVLCIHLLHQVALLAMLARILLQQAGEKFNLRHVLAACRKGRF